jgi:hypothetical protein
MLLVFMFSWLLLFSLVTSSPFFKERSETCSCNFSVGPINVSNVVVD